MIASRTQGKIGLGICLSRQYAVYTLAYRHRIIQRPERIGTHIEAVGSKARTHLVGKAGAEQHHLVGVTKLEARFD
jgi:hypothetical protein